jgi:hypothetical protein
MPLKSLKSAKKLPQQTLEKVNLFQETFSSISAQADDAGYEC